MHAMLTNKKIYKHSIFWHILTCYLVLLTKNQRLWELYRGASKLLNGFCLPWNSIALICSCGLYLNLLFYHERNFSMCRSKVVTAALFYFSIEHFSICLEQFIRNVRSLHWTLFLNITKNEKSMQDKDEVTWFRKSTFL